jgi:DNA-binding MarR family transcriptional regulator
MLNDAETAFTDRVAGFYAREYGFPPVAGRLLGYLLICQPPQRTIADLSEELQASRTAITAAVSLLERYHAVRRTRSAGQRSDHVGLDPRALDPTGFAAESYRTQAALAREALDLLTDGEPERRAMIAEAAEFYEFLAERMPALLTDWLARRSR